MNTSWIAFFVFLFLVLLSPRGVVAQDDPLDKLRMLEGTWSVRSAVYSDQGWQYADAATVAEFAILLGGRLVQEEVVIVTPAFSFEMHMLYSYDSNRKVYRMAATDKQGGIMDIYEGTHEGEALVFTNLRHETFFRTPDGREIAFRLRTEPMGDNSFFLEADMSDDRGTTWTPYTRSEYARIE